MKSRVLIGLLVVGVVVGFLVVPASPAYAWSHGHGRVFIGVGPGFCWGLRIPITGTRRRTIRRLSCSRRYTCSRRLRLLQPP